MRMLLKVQLPVDRANAALRDGTLQETMQSVLGELNAEATYFTTMDGERTALIFFEMEDSSQMPVAAEPFFQALDASVDFMPVMNADELQAGIQRAV